jgi:hypothetical protein
MKVTIERLTATKVEVELPAACPKCRASFDDVGLYEHQLLPSWQEATVVDGQLTDYGEYENDSEPLYTTGYGCGACQHILCSTELGVTP